MSFKERFKKIRNNYIINQVNNIVFPDFKRSNIIREKLTFSGRVQKVGFRLETSLIANKLGLTGWVKNNPIGEVDVEIQGEEYKINFLKQYMQSLKRIKVRYVVEQRMEPVYSEDIFIVIKEESFINKVDTPTE